MDRRTKQFGDFFTPDSVAAKLQSWSNVNTGDVQRVLDPCAGSGQLIWPFLAQSHNVEVTCVEPQADYLQQLIDTALFRGYAVELRGTCIIVRNFVAQT